MVAARLARGRAGRELLLGARTAEKLARQDLQEQEPDPVKGPGLAGDTEADRAAKKPARKARMEGERGPAEGLDLVGIMDWDREVEEALVATGVEPSLVAYCLLKSKPLRA